MCRSSVVIKPWLRMLCMVCSYVMTMFKRLQTSFNIALCTLQVFSTRRRCPIGFPSSWLAVPSSLPVSCRCSSADNTAQNSRKMATLVTQTALRSRTLSETDNTDVTDRQWHGQLWRHGQSVIRTTRTLRVVCDTDRDCASCVYDIDNIITMQCSVMCQLCRRDSQD